MTNILIRQQQILVNHQENIEIVLSFNVFVVIGIILGHLFLGQTGVQI